MLFPEGRDLVERNMKEKLAPQRVNALLRGRQLSPEQYKRKLSNMRAPPVVSPSMLQFIFHMFFCNKFPF